MANKTKYLYILYLNQNDDYERTLHHISSKGKVSLTFCTHSFQFLNWTSSWITLTNRAPNTRMNVESTPFFTFSCFCHKKFCSNFRNPLTFDGNAFSLSTAAEEKFWQIRNIEKLVHCSNIEFKIHYIFKLSNLPWNCSILSNKSYFVLLS